MTQSLKIVCLCGLLLTGLSLVGCGKKGEPQAHCQAETFPSSYDKT